MSKVSLEEYRELIKNILFKIDDICCTNDIRSFLFASTLLGAVRHKGKIRL